MMTAPVQKPRGADGSARALSPAEERVFRLYAQGLTRAEVAARLGVSVHTVKSQSCAVYERLGTGSLVPTLWRLGWVVLP